MQQRRAELVLARVAVLLDEADMGERAQDPVHGALGQAQFARQLDHAEAPVAPGELPQDRGRAFDGLDARSHRPGNVSERGSASPNSV